MERIITIACLVLSAAGLAFKTNQLEKMKPTVWLQLKRTPLLPLKQQWLKQRRRNFIL